MILRTNGYHENNAKQAMPAARNAYASRLSPTLRRRLVVTVIIAPMLALAPLARAAAGAPAAGVALLDGREDRVHLLLRVGQQGVDVGGRVGETFCMATSRTA
jgi:hypothetical protein